MKVLIGTNTLLPGSGIDRVVLIQAETLVKQGNQVKVVCFETNAEIESSIKQFAATNGIDIVQLPFSHQMTLERVRRLYPFLRWQSRKTIRSLIEWCDVFYAEQYPWSLVGVWAKRAGKQFIQINHGVADPSTFRRWTHRMYVNWINRLAVKYGRQADEVWSVSQALAQEWKDLTGQESTVFRPQESWLDQISERSPQEARGTLGQVAPYLLFVGRISPHKGIHILIEMMKKVWEVKPEVELKIIGKIADEAYATELKKGSDQRISFLGCVPDQELGLWYQGCSAYVTAAQWEGWNLPIVEALHFRRPVVCFDLPVHREFNDPLVHLVPPDDTKEFANACLKLI